MRANFLLICCSVLLMVVAQMATYRLGYACYFGAGALVGIAANNVYRRFILWEPSGISG